MSEPEHVEGVDFTEINPVLESLSYPTTANEIVDEHGDVEMERTNTDAITVAELFGQMGDNTFDSEEAVRQMLLSQMPNDSEGRQNYSDRGGSQPVETEAAEEAAEQTTEDLEDEQKTDDSEADELQNEDREQ